CASWVLAHCGRLLPPALPFPFSARAALRSWRHWRRFPPPFPFSPMRCGLPTLAQHCVRCGRRRRADARLWSRSWVNPFSIGKPPPDFVPAAASHLSGRRTIGGLGSALVGLYVEIDLLALIQ